MLLLKTPVPLIFGGGSGVGGQDHMKVLLLAQEAGIDPLAIRYTSFDGDGVASPESANNAAANGAFIPLLTLGVPGSGTTAIILGALLGLNITGPLMERNLRRALNLSQGDWGYLFSSPISITIWILAVISLFLPLVLGRVLSLGNITPDTSDTDSD
jgi:TctA family transporter